MTLNAQNTTFSLKDNKHSSLPRFKSRTAIFRSTLNLKKEQIPLKKSSIPQIGYLNMMANHFDIMKFTQEQAEKSKSEVLIPTPLTNSTLFPDPTKIPFAHVRHCYDLIKKNDQLVAQGYKPINLAETVISKLRPTKRKIMLVELTKMMMKDS